MLLAIDPGTERSGCVWLDGDGVPHHFGIFDNRDLVIQVHRTRLGVADVDADDMVIEMVSSYGMPVGRETFETVYWVGRFVEAYHGEAHRIYRKDVKLHFCDSARAKDANIWQAVLDRYGGKEKAVGKKKTPGPLYGITSHCRQALALGLAWLDGVMSEGL